MEANNGFLIEANDNKLTCFRWFQKDESTLNKLYLSQRNYSVIFYSIEQKKISFEEK